MSAPIQPSLTRRKTMGTNSDPALKGRATFNFTATWWFATNMKRCPQCNRVETDDALAFCRADGTVLVSDSASRDGDAGTAPLGSASAATEVETSILPHTTDAAMSRGTAPTTVLPAQQPPSTTRELIQPKRRRVIVVSLLFAAVTVASIVIGGYLYYSRKSSTAIDSIAVLPFENR